MLNDCWPKILHFRTQHLLFHNRTDINMYVCLCSWPDISYEYEIMMSLEISSVYSKALGHTHQEYQFGSSLMPNKDIYCILIVMRNSLHWSNFENIWWSCFWGRQSRWVKNLEFGSEIKPPLTSTIPIIFKIAFDKNIPHVD